jgi:hypothetical protein
MIGKLLGWLVIAFIVLWIVKDPVGAGTSVHNWVDGVLTFATSAGGH